MLDKLKDATRQVFSHLANPAKLRFRVWSSVIIGITPIVTLLLATLFLMHDDAFFHREFAKYNQRPNLEGKSLFEVHDEVVGFILGGGKKESLELFNEREITHLADVRNIVLKGYGVISGAIVVLLVAFWQAVRKSKSTEERWKTVSVLIILGGFSTLLAAFIVWVVASIDFGGAFTAFHRVLFAEGTWLFNPESELIVQLYQQQLFLNASKTIAYYIVGLSVFWISIGLSILGSLRPKRV